MIRAVTITFDVDVETGDVTNVKTQVEGQVKRKTTTTRKKDVVKELENTSKITREDNKLVFNNKAVSEMSLEPGDKVVIKYEKRNDSLFPIIGTDIAFNEENSGNKLTKSQTISYKGNQNIVLAEFGDEFTLKEHSENIWELIPLRNSIVPETIEEANKISEQVEPELLVDDDETYEVDELLFKL